MAKTSNNFNGNSMLIKLRNKYILIKIFDNLKENKLLNIIHYNKKYQKLMNKNIKDYEKEFSKIEIEIIPKKNKFGKFVNIFNKSINIYFNDNNEEIKKNQIAKDDKVTKIKIIISHKIKSLSKLFQDCQCIQIINFIKFKRNNITNMSDMFSFCSSLEELNLTNFNTNNVTNMHNMFSFCSSLKELNLTSFHTDNVTNMRSMFYACSSLKELNLTNFNTNKVTIINDINFFYFFIMNIVLELFLINIY